MTDLVHIPVLPRAAADYLDPRPGHIYCDCTLGRGGHATATLQASAPDGILIGIDRDSSAVEACRSSLAEFGTRLVVVHETFGSVDKVLAELGHEQVDGFLLDLGPSSPQFDDPERGFAFSHSGPIDMRMDQSAGESALDLIRRVDSDELALIIRDYGEERYHRRVAGRIKEAYLDGRLQTTLDLAEVIDKAIPARSKRSVRIHPATRTFQALRIAVNRELDELTRFLEIFPDLLAPGGRCVIISFHSLEDRLVKRRFRELAFTSSLPPEYAERAGEPTHATCEILTRKPIFASDDEIARNPRARSARLRACEKARS